jgi:Glycosyl hydrolases family 16
MPPPTGYSNMIFQDTFTGTTLDLTKWNPALGANGGLWNNRGKLGKDPNGFPYTGNNTDANGISQSADSTLYAKSQISVNNGLSITAKPNANLNPGGIHYPYVSGALTTVTQPGSGPGVSAAFTLPKTGKWYVQARCKFSDMSHGIAPCIWFLPGPAGSSFNEMDFVQGCFAPQKTTNPALYNNYPCGAGYFLNNNDVCASVPNVGFDATTSFHVYGVEFNWATKTVTGYADGKVVWTCSPGTMPVQAYEIIINMQAWKPGQGWCTGVDGTTGGVMQVAEIQAYAA